MKFSVRNSGNQSRAVPYKESLSWWWMVGVGIGFFITALIVLGVQGQARAAEGVSPEIAQASVHAVQRYSQAVAASDQIAVAQNDFVCLLKMMESGSVVAGGFPESSDPVYAWCWDRLAQAHAEVIDQRDRALDELWPGVGKISRSSTVDSNFGMNMLKRRLRD